TTVTAAHKWIDLDEGSIGGQKRFVKAGKKLHCRVDLRASQPEPERDLACLERFQPHAGIHILLENGVRIFCCDLLDLHSAGGRSHENWFTLGPIYQDAEIEFFLDRQSLFNYQPPH